MDVRFVQLLRALALRRWLARCRAGIDVLVSNVAVSPHMGAFFDTTEVAWSKLFEVNITAAFFLTKECLPHMAFGSSVCYGALLT
jgi:NAD(P)-dependent dehydrogenase (short-subunit alcohol dehydrogenase family)